MTYLEQGDKISINDGPYVPIIKRQSFCDADGRLILYRFWLSDKDYVQYFAKEDHWESKDRITINKVVSDNYIWNHIIDATKWDIK